VTPLYSILLDIIVIRIIFILIGVIGIAAIYLAYRKKELGTNRAKGPLLLDLNKKASASPAELSAAVPSGDSSTPTREPAPQAPVFNAYQKRSGILSDLFGAVLIILSLIVAAGFTLILLSQPTIDRMAQDLRTHYGAPQQEKISLLFLGDTVKDNEFQVQANIRNISKAPIEHLDAAIRFYSHTGRILETVMVRMDKEILAPDEQGQFRLTYPNSKVEFSRYAMEFKLRQGELIAYRDMRQVRQQNSRNP
jgi:hypothetical protein